MGWFSKSRKAQPPYDTLSVEQQRALYFLLEYFGLFTGGGSYETMHRNALNYLEKAAYYLGISKCDVKLLRPYHQKLDGLYSIIKDIKNKAVLDFMVNNCYNLVILSNVESVDRVRSLFVSFWGAFGYSYDDIFDITRKYMYRTEI